MTEFKIGDKVTRTMSSHNPRLFGEMGVIYTIKKVNYPCDYTSEEGIKINCISSYWKRVEECSEEAAVKLLEERGYTITPPPEPLKGKMVIYLSKDKTIWGVPEHRYNEWSPTVKEGHVIVAIVDWVEGEGL